MNNIKNVVFDLGGVLVDWNPRYLYRKIFADQQEMERFLEEVCHHAWNLEQDRGRDFGEACRLKAQKFPHYREQIHAYHQRWPEMLGGPIEGSVKILDALRDRDDIRVLALTNWSHQTFPIALERYDFLHWFEATVVSGVVKMVKPDEDIFDYLFKTHNINPHESFFIDDSLPNVETSRKMGMTGHHFRDPEGLHRALQELKVLK